jgi:hypothetical protein
MAQDDFSGRIRLLSMFLVLVFAFFQEKDEDSSDYFLDFSE